jgi:outer membrane protein assembly factor BamB
MLQAENLVSNMSASPVIGSDSAIYITTEDGQLCRLDRYGNTEWTYSTSGYYCSSPAVVRYPNATGDIICFKVSSSKMKQDEDSLYMIKSDGTRFAASAIPQASGGEFVSSPMVGSDGTIYIGGGIYYDEEGNEIGRGLFALTGRGAVINSSWPLFRHDTKNSGRK